MAEEAKQILLRLGIVTFGEPDDATRAAIDAIQDRERVEDLIVRVPTAKKWADLLAEPSSTRARRGAGKRKRG